MGILTDFFVASPLELKGAFPAWLEVADEPTTREIENIFTRQKQTVPYWPPKQRPSQKASAKERLSNFRDLPHAQFKSIDVVKLATLNELIGNIPFEEGLKQFDRPALIDPWESEETELYRLDERFVAVLASIRDDELAGVATEWAATEEMQLDGAVAVDCQSVLEALVQLAKDAKQSKRALYHWWSL